MAVRRIGTALAAAAVVVAVLAAAGAVVVVVEALENGLARTPPMGFLAWERFRCGVDCTADPANCIGERLFMETADAMVAGGFRDAGYEYVNLDDCWMADTRDAHGQLQPNGTRFPNGIDGLARYVHAKGLKLGLYEALGPRTCQGYPGMAGHFEADVQRMVGWGIDMLKVDGCSATPESMNVSYPQIGEYVRRTGRAVVYSCSWPDYIRVNHLPLQYALMTRHCNLWRNFDDVEDQYDSVTAIIRYWAEADARMIGAARPGAWNDPDQLIIGNFGLTTAGQYRVQMGLWAMMAAPLLMSTDVRNLTDDARAVLLNRDVIAVNQDVLGRQGTALFNATADGTAQVWARELADGSVAVAFLNMAKGGAAVEMSVPFEALGGFGAVTSARVRDLWAGKDVGVQSGTLSASVPAMDVAMYRLQPVYRTGATDVNDEL